MIQPANSRQYIHTPFGFYTLFVFYKPPCLHTLFSLYTPPSLYYTIQFAHTIQFIHTTQFIIVNVRDNAMPYVSYERCFPRPRLLLRRDWLIEGQDPIQTPIPAEAKGQVCTQSLRCDWLIEGCGPYYRVVSYSRGF